MQEHHQTPKNSPSHREIRALYDTDCITLYQAYSTPIATAALQSQNLSASPLYNRTRTTWIKPSWCWMMYRSGYSYKDANQECILALRMKHEHFLTLLRSAYLAGTDLPAEGAARAAIVQWDPERGPALEKLGWRSIQIGIRGALAERWVAEWIESIEDVTEMARGMKEVVEREPGIGVEELVERGLMPRERVYDVDDGIREKLGMDV